MSAASLAHMVPVSGMSIPLRHAGLSLIELLISVTLGLLIVLGASSLFLSSKSGYATQDDYASMDEAGRYALEILSRTIRQAAYKNLDAHGSPQTDIGHPGVGIIGLDGQRVEHREPGIASPSSAYNGSDTLAIRYFGSGRGEGDGTILNCAGFPVSAWAIGLDEPAEPGWSIFYVAQDASGEPQLYCKYSADAGWASDAIVRGVESFQVLYGVDLNGDGLPDRLLRAAEISALDHESTAGPQGVIPAASSAWGKVVTVKIGLLLRGSNNVLTGFEPAVHDLFGPIYSISQAATDEGTRLVAADFPAALRRRPRRVYSALVRTRNQWAAGGNVR